MNAVFYSTKHDFTLSARLIAKLRRESTLFILLGFVVLTVFNIVAVAGVLIVCIRLLLTIKWVSCYVVGVSVNDGKIQITQINPSGSTTRKVLDGTRTTCRVEQSGPNMFGSSCLVFKSGDVEIRQYFFGEWDKDLADGVVRELRSQTGLSIRTYM